MNKKASYVNIQNEKIRTSMRKKENFTLIDNDFMLRIISDCGANSFAVYMYLLSKLNRNTGECFPSINTMVLELGMSNKTIINVVAKLEDKGYLGIEKSKSQTNNWFINNYFFKYPKEMIVDASEEEVIAEPTPKSIKPRPTFKDKAVKNNSPVENKKVEAVVEDEVESKTALGKLKLLKSKMNREYSKTKSIGSLKNLNSFIDQVISGRLEANTVKEWLVDEVGFITEFEFTLDIETVKLVKVIKK